MRYFWVPIAAVCGFQVGDWAGHALDSGFAVHGRAAFAIVLVTGLLVALLSAAGALGYYLEKDDEEQRSTRPRGEVMTMATDPKDVEQDKDGKGTEKPPQSKPPVR